MINRWWVGALWLCMNIQAHSAPVQAYDDTGVSLTLPTAAQRVVALAPHAVELVYAAGAGHTLVGAVEYSDTPAAARRLPRVGNHAGFDLERIAALRPDLIIAWPLGGARQLQKIESLGIPVYRSAPRTLEAIAVSTEQLGRLLASEPAAQAAARRYRDQLAALRQRYAGQTGERPLRVFYQSWPQPLMTIGADHTINEALEICGARNVFNDVNTAAPVVSREAVLARHPQVVLLSGSAERQHAVQAQWKEIPVVVVSGDALVRPTLRIAQGIAALCRALSGVKR